MRELLISGLPSLAVYGTEANDPRSVIILQRLHGAMLWSLGNDSSGHAFCKAQPGAEIGVRGICKSRDL